MTTKTIPSPWIETIRGKPEPGTVASRSRQTSMADVVRFTEMTGDRNPIHYDAALAGTTRLGGLVVQGGVTTGLLNAVVAEDLPGPGTVFLETNWRFLKAVKVGETITAIVRVVETRDDKPICRLETTISDSSGDVCVSGTAVTFTIPLHPHTDETATAKTSDAASVPRTEPEDPQAARRHQTGHAEAARRRNTIQQIADANRWTPHTVRGLMAGVLKKKLGFEVTSEKVENRGRVYKLPAA